MPFDVAVFHFLATKFLDMLGPFESRPGFNFFVHLQVHSSNNNNNITVIATKI